MALLYWKWGMRWGIYRRITGGWHWPSSQEEKDRRCEGRMEPDTDGLMRAPMQIKARRMNARPPGGRSERPFLRPRGCDTTPLMPERAVPLMR
jgi:hypothetical protein